MLKIKDNVDLKELEKFGIKQYGQHYNAITKFSIPYLSILNERGRKIVCYTNEDLDVLFDLIQAGLVEKVEEQKWKNLYFWEMA